MSCHNNFWVLRQNYGEITDQKDMINLIKEKRLVTCPWGGWGTPRQNVIDGIYNTRVCDESRRSSKGQDRRFVEEIKIGDIIVIPFVGRKECIVARIVSNVDYATECGLSWKNINGLIKISKEVDGLPFRPISRHIEILNDKFVVDDKRKLGMSSLSKLNKSVVEML